MDELDDLLADLENSVTPNAPIHDYDTWERTAPVLPAKHTPAGPVGYGSLPRNKQGRIGSTFVSSTESVETPILGTDPWPLLSPHQNSKWDVSTPQTEGATFESPRPSMAASRDDFGKGRGAGSTPIQEVQRSVVEIVGVGVEFDGGMDPQFDEEVKSTVRPSPSSPASISVSEGSRSLTSSLAAKPTGLSSLGTSGRAVSAFAQSQKRIPNSSSTRSTESLNKLSTSISKENMSLPTRAPEVRPKDDDPLGDALNDLMSSIKEFELDMASPGLKEPPSPLSTMNRSTFLTDSSISKSSIQKRRGRSRSMLALNDDDTGETSPTSVGDSKRFDNASNSQLSSASDSVRNKYECCVCEQLIASDKVVFALGKYWHVEHFACQGRGSGKTGKCDRLLANTPFFEHDETLYCDRCYYEEFSPKCAFCSEPIKETCISALGKTFHRDHFFCCQCGTTLDPGRNFMEYDGKAYCDDDYQALFSKPCFACCRPLTKEHIIAQGRAYHEDCFRCRDCRKLLTGLAGGFFEHEGQAYCEEHYYLRRDTSASVCPTCKKPVVGRVINALGRRYHADHFVCTFCKKSLISNGEKGPGITTSQFKEQQGKPYCNPCHIKLFG